MSVWNPENIKDVAESVGITSLSDDVLQGLCSDIEYRISQVLEEALKFMRHSKRSTLTTQDVAQALRVLDVEPLYGYESTRPLRFGEASIGPGQPLFYVEDEEVDFEKLINAPLPKVPREITFTGRFITGLFMTLDLIIIQHIGWPSKVHNLQYHKTLQPQIQETKNWCRKGRPPTLTWQLWPATKMSQSNPWSNTFYQKNSSFTSRRSAVLSSTS